jgi:hypothetical protein
MGWEAHVEKYRIKQGRRGRNRAGQILELKMVNEVEIK